MHETNTIPIVVSYGPRRVQWLVVCGCALLAAVFFASGFRSGAIIPLVFALFCSFSPETYVLPGAGASGTHSQLTDFYGTAL